MGQLLQGVTFLRLQNENKSLREENKQIERALSRIDRLYHELSLNSE
jgi:hypothetical protein